MPSDDNAATGRPLGLGIDAGGTQTRWALALPSVDIVASGHVVGLTPLLLGNAAGRERIGTTLGEIAKAVLAVGRPLHVVAGMTGFGDAQRESLATMIASPFGIGDTAVSLRGDMEIAYLDAFAPGEGYLVYAGT